MRGAPEVVAREHEVACGGVLALLVQRAVPCCSCSLLCCNHLCDCDGHAHRALRVAAAGAAEVAAHGARGARQLGGGERQSAWAPAWRRARSLGRRERDAPGRLCVARSSIIRWGGSSSCGVGGRRRGRGRRRRNNSGSALCGAFCAPRRRDFDASRRQQLRASRVRRRRGISGRGRRRRRGGELQPQRGGAYRAAVEPGSQHLRVATRARRLRDAAGAAGEAAGSCAAAQRLRHGLATGAEAAGSAGRAAQPRKARARAEQPRRAARRARLIRAWSATQAEVCPACARSHFAATSRLCGARRPRRYDHNGGDVSLLARGAHDIMRQVRERNLRSAAVSASAPALTRAASPLVALDPVSWGPRPSRTRAAGCTRGAARSSRGN